MAIDDENEWILNVSSLLVVWFGLEQDVDRVAGCMDTWRKLEGAAAVPTQPCFHLLQFFLIKKLYLHSRGFHNIFLLN